MNLMTIMKLARGDCVMFLYILVKKLNGNIQFPFQTSLPSPKERGMAVNKISREKKLKSVPCYLIFYQPQETLQFLE